MRALLFTAAVLIVVSVLGILYLSASNAPSSEECTPYLQLALVQAFKGDVLLLVLVGGVVAGVLYQRMLHDQVFFPSRDVLRMAVAVLAAGSMVLGLVMVDQEWFGSSCLHVALGPESAVPEEVPALCSLFGHLVGNLYVAISLDFVLCGAVLVLVVRGVRQFLWQRA